MSASELPRAVAASHEALALIIGSDASGFERLFAEDDDVTLGNPFGPFVRGRSEAVATLRAAAARYRHGEVDGVDLVASLEGDDLACVVEVERFRAHVGGSADLAEVILRVTSVYRVGAAGD